MLTIKEIRFHLRDRNLAQVAREIGMSRQQLHLIANGITQDPRGSTLEKLTEYLEREMDEEDQE